GGITIYRTEVRPFADKQIDLVSTFAAQAVIAIENVRLFKELEARNKDLGESLEQQTATAEILRVISGSPTDVAPVFRVILEKANRLSNSAMSVLWMHEGDGIFRAVESVGINPEFVNWISGRRVTFAAPAFNPR